MQAWNVYDNGCKIDTVWFSCSMTAKQVCSALINQDSYSTAIAVRRSNKG